MQCGVGCPAACLIHLKLYETAGIARRYETAASWNNSSGCALCHLTSNAGSKKRGVITLPLHFYHYTFITGMNDLAIEFITTVRTSASLFNCRYSYIKGKGYALSKA